MLAKNEGQILTPRMILSGLYLDSESNIPKVKILDVFTCLIRRKLDKVYDGSSSVLRHVWGRGYAFGKPLEEQPMLVPKFLPDPERRWVIRSKIQVVKAVEKSWVNNDDLFRYYPDLSAEEFAEWQRYYHAYGRDALKTTRVQEYALQTIL